MVRALSSTSGMKHSPRPHARADHFHAGQQRAVQDLASAASAAPSSAGVEGVDAVSPLPLDHGRVLLHLSPRAVVSRVEPAAPGAGDGSATPTSPVGLLDDGAHARLTTSASSGSGW